MEELKINDRFKAACPPLKSDEFNRLVENIQKSGRIYNPILVWNNTIIDGHNRYEIAQMYEIPFDVSEVQFESDDEAVIWIKEYQLGQRNLEDHQAWQMVKEIEELLKEKGKERMSEGGQGLPTVGKPSHNTRQELADKLNWSTGKVSQAQYVDKHADEETKEQVYKGEKSFNQAYQETRSITAEQAEEYQIIETLTGALSMIHLRYKEYEFISDIIDMLRSAIKEARSLKKQLKN